MAGNAALGLWVRAGAWCGANLTDGALPKHMIGTFGAQKRDARKLVEVGLWVETKDGYQFHEWEQMQPSKAEVLAERAANAKRQKAWRDRQRNGVTDSVTDDVTHGPTNGAPTRPDPTLKEPEAKASGGTRKRATRIPEDFRIDENMRHWASTRVPNIDIAFETEKFINHWTAASGKTATKLDWLATWRNWMLNSKPTVPGTNYPARLDHGQRTDLKAAAMLAKIGAWDAQQDNQQLELETGTDSWI